MNRQSIPTIELIGEHKTPVIIIDDYADNLDELIDHVVKNNDFRPDEITNYPGIRSAIPKALVVDYLKPLMQGLYRIYNLADSLTPNPKDNYFSLITKQASELTTLQTWPHFDTPNPNLIAVIHYLGKGSHGGTGFFKHNKSGLERINQKSKHDYLQYAHKYFQSVNESVYGYCNEYHSEFSCYKKIAYKSNRLIVFPGQLLHSTLVKFPTDVNSSPQHGRLTANMFIEFK